MRRLTGPAAGPAWLGLLIALVFVTSACVGATPSTAPGQSPDGTSAAPPSLLPVDSTPVIVEDVTDRAGVPAALKSVEWLANTVTPWPGEEEPSSYSAGILGTTARIVLPPGEIGAAVGRGLVASVIVPDSGGSILVVRDITSGTEIWRVSSESVISRIAFAGETLIWTGWTQTPTAIEDAGVYRIELGAGRGSMTRLVAGGPFEPTLGERAERGPLRVSPSGRLVASSIGGESRVDTQVVDLATSSLLTTIAGVTPVGVTDSQVIALEAGALRGVELVGGKTRWSLAIGTHYGVSLLTGGAVAIAAHVARDEYRIEAIELETGSLRRLLTTPAAEEHLYLVPGLAGGNDVVLAADPNLGTIRERGPAEASVLNVATGKIQEDVFVIGTP